MKTADKIIQLLIMILIGVSAVSLVGLYALFVLFPALAIVQLTSALIRTVFEFNRTPWHRKMLSTYWLLVAAWGIINFGFYAIASLHDAYLLSMMGFSLPIAIWYYVSIGEEADVLQEIIDKGEKEENARLAALFTKTTK